MNCYETVRRAADFIAERTELSPRLLLTLGSGLGGLVDEIEEVCGLRYSEIPGFPVSSVEGHDGRLSFGYLRGVPVAAMHGRVHYYEGYSMEQVVMPVRTAAMLGAKAVFLTNAAGGIQDGMRAGDLMVIEDHISSFVPSPLRGGNDERLGPRFPDMSGVYDARLKQAIYDTAAELGFELKRGIYLQTAGPQFETPAEIRMMKALGADAVGMSTACEAIAARHMGLLVCGLSCISNLAAGLSARPLSHAEVQETANAAGPRFSAVVSGAVEKMGGLLR